MLGTLKWGKLPGASLLVTQPFASIEKLATLTTPMLFLHGTADRVVPHTMSDELFAAALKVPPDFKSLVKIDVATHSESVRRASGRAACRERVCQYVSFTVIAD